MSTVPSVAVFASGGGSNLQSLLDRFGADGSPDASCRIGLVISDRPGIRALERAKAAGVPSAVIPPKEYESKEAFGDVLLETLGAHGVDIVALAGYLKLVPESVVQTYRGRIINIHPGPLPTFGGSGMWGHHVHEAVLKSGVAVSGPTIHFVDERFDTGPIIAQWPVPVLDDDTPDTLAARVLKYEHKLYPAVLRALARGEVEWCEERHVKRTAYGEGGFQFGDEESALGSVGSAWRVEE